jgi:hypothetical protein
MILSQSQLSQLIRLYAEQVVDNMDANDLCEFAINTICDNMKNMNPDDVQEEIAELCDQEVLNGFFENIMNMDSSKTVH